MGAKSAKPRRPPRFRLLDAADLDEAIEPAARIPAARLGGAVEIRPVVAGGAAAAGRRR
ncbi:hypothetical protein [Microbispora sp. NPDC049125]|uniref:hypothetical protein n=1 Tax=Microbispora sp. NPDC049125 TaxID=3154929 RepID=UPI003465492E